MNIYQEADDLLESIGLIKQLEAYGVTELVGSYRYQTMVARDIDISPWPSDLIDFTLRSSLLSTLSKLTQCRSMSMSDLLHFPEFAKKPLNGIWFGLKLVHPKTSNEWNIDIWLISKPDDPTQQPGSLHQQMLHITNMQREAIIAAKKKLENEHGSVKGVTSTQIYKNILDI